MSKQSPQRRHLKHLARLRALSESQRQAESARRLAACRREANRRADRLGERVWDLAKDPETGAILAALDPSGASQEDVNRACAEAIACVAGGHLVRGSRPPADRIRRPG